MAASAAAELAAPQAASADEEAARAAVKQSLQAKLGADWARVFGRSAQRKLGTDAKPPSSWHLNPPETYYPLLEAMPFWQTPWWWQSSGHGTAVEQSRPWKPG